MYPTPFHRHWITSIPSSPPPPAVLGHFFRGSQPNYAELRNLLYASILGVQGEGPEHSDRRTIGPVLLGHGGIPVTRMKVDGCQTRHSFFLSFWTLSVFSLGARPWSIRLTSCGGEKGPMIWNHNGDVQRLSIRSSIRSNPYLHTNCGIWGNPNALSCGRL